MAEFDLAGLENASSAAVALLIAWFRYGHAHGKVVRFLRVPAAIMNIIEVSNLAEVLPIAGARRRRSEFGAPMNEAISAAVASGIENAEVDVQCWKVIGRSSRW